VSLSPGAWHYYYGSGATAAELDTWWLSVLTVPGLHVITAGDDSLIIINRDGYLTVIEGDGSQFDHTIRSGALGAEYRVMRWLGVSDNTIALLKANSAGTCHISDSRSAYRAAIHRGEERNTGGVTTTVGNSLLMGIGCAWAAQQDDILDAFQRLGLVMKLNTSTYKISELGHTAWPPSFLKGTWWLCDTEWHWGPLLSRILKLGKTISDPRRTYHLESLHEALIAHVASVGLSLTPSTFPEPFKQVFTRVTHPRARKTTEEFWAWRPASDTAHTPTHWPQQAGAWYGVDPESVIEFSEIYSTAEVGTFIAHPFCAVMALRDYN